MVTRGDLLRALHEPAALERPLPDPEATAAVRERLDTIERLRDVLPAIAAAAGPDEGVYLVGGAVRDVLLGEQSLDLDVMVEGDAIDPRAASWPASSAPAVTRTRSSRRQS